MNPTEALFSIALLVCFYVYLGYPILLLVLSRWRPRPVQAADIQPSVSLIVPVHDEERIIGAKIENCLALQYPTDRFEVLVVSDGSNDRTVEIARGFDGGPVRVTELPRRGKLFALDEGVRQSSGEILVFTDAGAFLQPESLNRLVRSFADPEVGGAFGSYSVNRDRDGSGGGAGLYWRLDQWQKTLESRIGSAVGASGAFYAVRRSLYRPIENPAQADDFAISVRVVLQERRLVYVPEAVAFEREPRDSRREFGRRVRIANHSLRSLLDLGSALWRSGLYSLQLVSHKVLRYLAPVFLLALLLSNLRLAQGSSLFTATLAGQFLAYSLALVASLLQVAGSRSGILSAPYHFYVMNAAALIGLLSILAGTRIAAWSPRHGVEAPVKRGRPV